MFFQNNSEYKVDRTGRACFPDGITEIRDRAFDGRKELRFAEIPATVKRIGARAFADCPNLEKVVFHEGLEEMDGNVFTGCTALKTAVFPNSLKDIHGYVFYRSAFNEPVLNVSGDVLYRCPDIPGQTSYVVPKDIKRIQDGAFLYLENLKEIILPDSLEIIHMRAFQHTGIRKIKIPASVREIEARAFWSCEELEEVTLLCDSKNLQMGAFESCPKVRILSPGQKLDFEERQRLQGKGIIGIPRRMEVPDRDFWVDEHFASLARKCATGDADAMIAFADYYESLGTDKFYALAANFWRYRAYLYGSAEAAQWRLDWLKNNPDTVIPMAMWPKLSGGEGKKLRALGFSFFDEDRTYDLKERYPEGIVLVNAWSDTEGPDEDGFGMEELYDWWYLDECFNPIHGVQMIHNYSGRERSVLTARFEEQYQNAVRGVQQKTENGR